MNITVRLLLAAAFVLTAAAQAADLPNILWVTSEDHGQQLGCYGDPVARTPNVEAIKRSNATGDPPRCT